MRSRLTLTVIALVSAVTITALFIAINVLPIWAALIVVLALVALAFLVGSRRIADTRYTFLVGAGGGVAAVAIYILLAIPDTSGFIPLVFAVALAIGVGVLSGRRQLRSRRDALGVTAAAAASTLVAAVFSLAIAAVAFVAYAFIACSHFVNSCPFD
ncbi:MAG TPA: hypothetical protein VII83_06770 [Gaiellaceae bacterium]|jgi:hypothetical protein